MTHMATAYHAPGVDGTEHVARPQTTALRRPRLPARVVNQLDRRASSGLPSIGLLLLAARWLVVRHRNQKGRRPRRPATPWPRRPPRYRLTVLAYWGRRHPRRDHCPPRICGRGDAWVAPPCTPPRRGWPLSSTVPYFSAPVRRLSAPSSGMRTPDIMIHNYPYRSSFGRRSDARSNGRWVRHRRTVPAAVSTRQRHQRRLTIRRTPSGTCGVRHLGEWLLPATCAVAQRSRPLPEDAPTPKRRSNPLVQEVHRQLRAPVRPQPV